MSCSAPISCAVRVAASNSPAGKVGETAVTPTGVRSQFVVRDLQHQGAVDAAGKGDEDGLHVGDKVAEAVKLYRSEASMVMERSIHCLQLGLCHVADHHERIALRVEILLRHPLDVFLRDPLDPFGILREILKSQAVKFYLSQYLGELVPWSQVAVESCRSKRISPRRAPDRLPGLRGCSSFQPAPLESPGSWLQSASEN